MTVKHAHFLVRKTAIELAGELYEVTMANNQLYADWKALCPALTPRKLESMFIAKAAPLLLEKARAILAQMLSTNISQSLKDQIFDALIKDAALKRGRLEGHQTVTKH